MLTEAMSSATKMGRVEVARDGRAVIGLVRSQKMTEGGSGDWWKTHCSDVRASKVSETEPPPRSRCTLNIES